MKTIATAVFLIFVFLPVMGFAEPETKEVTAKGVGSSEREAVEDAFRNAIEESIGLYVSSETQFQNEKLIKENILTSSSGYIDNYRLSSVNNENGMTKVEIKALVKIQDVKSKLVSLNVSVLSVDDLTNVHARLSTKLKRSRDAEEILKKELPAFFHPNDIMNLLDVKIFSYKIHENEANKDDNTVPYEISFETSINVLNYNKKIQYLAKIFEDLGGRNEGTFEVSFFTGENGVKHPYLKNEYFTDYTKRLGVNIKQHQHELIDDVNMYFGLIFIENGGCKFKLFSFPSEYKKIYPWKEGSGVYCDIFSGMKYVFNFKNRKDEIVYKKDIASCRDTEEMSCKYQLNIFPFSWDIRGHSFKEGWSYRESDFAGYYVRYGGNNIGPFIGSLLKQNEILKYKDMINVDLLYDIKKIEVELAIKENDK